MKFHTDVCPNAVFSVGQATYQCINGDFQTDEAEVIDALKKNVNFKPVLVAPKLPPTTGGGNSAPLNTGGVGPAPNGEGK